MTHAFAFHGVPFVARPAGTLFWPGRNALIVADLHLGKSARMARRGGALLPPWGDDDTLTRLAAELDATGATQVISLGDAFDDDDTGSLTEGAARALAALGARAEFLWITGNHDSGARPPFGRVCDTLTAHGLTLRHIAAHGNGPDLSGHYHPKLRVAGRSRRCFVVGRDHLILPAFGQFTGGLDCTDPTLRDLGAGGIALLTGPRIIPCPLP